MLATLLLTGLILFLSTLVRRGRRTFLPAADPLKGFRRPDAARHDGPEDGAAAEAPIGLARLRARSPDPARAAEPRFGTDAVNGGPAAPHPSADASREDDAPAGSPFQAPPSAPVKPDPFAALDFLMTLPFERRSGLSTAHADLCGIGIEAVFFEPDAVSACSDDALRLVPFLPEGARLLLTESDRETFRAGELFAQPDAVIEVPAGFIALEYKSKGGRLEDPLRWAEMLRTKDLLQTIFGALALSASSGRPVAPVLRTQNAVFYLRPTTELRRLLTAGIEPAARFLALTSEGSAPQGVSASDCAALLSPAVVRRFPRPDSAASTAGREAHARLLARRT